MSFVPIFFIIIVFNLLFLLLCCFSFTVAVDIDLSTWPTTMPYVFPSNVSSALLGSSNNDYTFKNANLARFEIEIDLKNRTSIRITNAKIAFVGFFSVMENSKIQIDNCFLRAVQLRPEKCDHNRGSCGRPTFISDSIINISSNKIFPPFFRDSRDEGLPLVDLPNADLRRPSVNESILVQISANVNGSENGMTKILVENNRFFDAARGPLKGDGSVRELFKSEVLSRKSIIFALEQMKLASPTTESTTSCHGISTGLA